jgi:hypothetical protein
MLALSVNLSLENGPCGLVPQALIDEIELLFSCSIPMLHIDGRAA